MIKHLLLSRGRLPRLGIIRLGVKEQRANGAEIPKEVDYFVVPRELAAIAGERPTKFTVLFPSDDPERVLDASYIRYAGKLLTLKCDGEQFIDIKKDGTETRGACQKPEQGPCPCGARAVGRLNVILYDAPLGVWQVMVGGDQRLADLMTELIVFRTAFGRLTDIVFEIERVPTEIQVRTEKGRLSRTGWPVHVRCSFTAKQARALRGLAAEALPLAAGTIEEHDDEPVPTDEPEVAQVTPLPERAEPGAAPAPVQAAPTIPTPSPVPPPMSPQPAKREASAAPAVHDVEYDVSMCYAAAAKIGVRAELYDQYLKAVYGTPGSDLTEANTRTEAAALRAVAGDESKGMVLKADMIRRLNNALKRRKP